MGNPDAGDGDGGAGGLLVQGIVCEVDDFEQPSVCIDEPAGLTIKINDQTTTSDDVGAFEVTFTDRPEVVDIEVSDPSGPLRTSLIRLAAPAEGNLDGMALPILSPTSMLAIEVALGEGPTDNLGVIVGLVNRDSGPLAGAQVAVAPAGTLGGTYYDSLTYPYVDIGAATGESGVFAIFSVPVADPEVSFSVTPSDTEDPIDVVAPVDAGAISFVSYWFPAPE
jgi:hypothetical protein